MRKAIAILGEGNNTELAIAGKLAGASYRLLLVSGHNNRLQQLASHLLANTPGSEVEILDCEKDGCWEADIIIMVLSSPLIKETAEKIREVATQKIVICISEPVSEPFFNTSAVLELKKILPWSKIVQVFLSPGIMEGFLAGNDADALEEASAIMRLAGFKIINSGTLSALVKKLPY